MKKRSEWSRGTIAAARREAAKVRKELVEEVARLLDAGAVDPDSHNRGMMIGVALENIASRYIGNRHYVSRHERRAYLNLQKF